MAALLTNNGTGVLSAGISAVTTSLTLNAGQGASFPVLASPDFFMATIFNAGGTMEIVKVTARTADTLTIVRGQEGTAGFAFSAADKVDMRMTAAAFANKLDKDTGGTIAGALTVGGGAGLTVTTSVNAGSAIVGGGGIVTSGGVVSGAGGLTTSGSASIGGSLSVTGTVFAAAMQVAGVNVADVSSTQTLSSKALSSPVLNQVYSLSTIFDDGSNTTYHYIGFRGLPQNPQNGNYTLALSDRSKHVYSKNVGAQNINLPAHATIAFIVEDFVTIINRGTTPITFTPAGGVTLEWMPTGAAGVRTIAAHGMITAIQVEVDVWVCSGVGVS